MNKSLVVLADHIYTTGGPIGFHKRFISKVMPMFGEEYTFEELYDPFDNSSGNTTYEHLRQLEGKKLQLESIVPSNSGPAYLMREVGSSYVLLVPIKF